MSVANATEAKSRIGESVMNRNQHAPGPKYSEFAEQGRAKTWQSLHPNCRIGDADARPAITPAGSEHTVLPYLAREVV
jgi:hypothetical protein